MRLPLAVTLLVLAGCASVPSTPTAPTVAPPPDGLPPSWLNETSEGFLAPQAVACPAPCAAPARLFESALRNRTVIAGEARLAADGDASPCATVVFQVFLQRAGSSERLPAATTAGPPPLRLSLDNLTLPVGEGWRLGVAIYPKASRLGPAEWMTFTGLDYRLELSLRHRGMESGDAQSAPREGSGPAAVC